MKYNLRQIRLAITMTVLAAMTVSCQIGRQYTRPDIKMPATLADEESTDSASLADHSWTEIYTDSILQELILKSLAHNKDLQMAAARVKEMAAMKRIDYAAMFPSLGLRIYGEKNRTTTEATIAKATTSLT